MRKEISVESLEIADYNPREVRDPSILSALEKTVKTNGVIEPLLVRETENGKYEILDGGNRFLSAKQAGLKTLPCIVLNISRVDAMKTVAIIHSQVDDLTIEEKGKMVNRLLSEKVFKNADELADFIGFSKAEVYRWIAAAKVETSKPAKVPTPVKQQIATLPKTIATQVIEEVEELPEEGRRIVGKVLPEIKPRLEAVEKPTQAREILREEVMKRVESLSRDRRFILSKEYVFKIERGDVRIQVGDYYITVPRADFRAFVRELNAFFESMGDIL
ncbi:MAG: ParB/RepB/Spo0J family partition protein [Candidatus Caldarchaeum sp.]